MAHLWKCHGIRKCIFHVHVNVMNMKKQQRYWQMVDTRQTGPSCSKLSTSLVSDSLKFTSSDTQICWNILLKKCAYLLQFFSAKNIRILCIESAKTVNEMTLNELVKLTTLWTTGPRTLTSENVPSDMCAQRRLWSTCAFAENDYNLNWVHFR